MSTPPPADAIVLFDGKDLSHWVTAGRGGQTSEPKWKVENGYMEIVPRGGRLMTKEKFGDMPAPHRVDGAQGLRRSRPERAATAASSS